MFVDKIELGDIRTLNNHSWLVALWLLPQSLSVAPCPLNAENITTCLMATAGTLVVKRSCLFHFPQPNAYKHGTK